MGQVREDGLCPRDSLQVEFLSRSTALPAQAVEETMMAMLPFLCVEEEEVESMATGRWVRKWEWEEGGVRW